MTSIVYVRPSGWLYTFQPYTKVYNSETSYYLQLINDINMTPPTQSMQYTNYRDKTSFDQPQALVYEPNMVGGIL